MLHSVVGCPKGRARWCGPSAVSIITGLPYMSSLELLKRERFKRGGYIDRSSVVVKGTNNEEMRMALFNAGYVLRPIHFRYGITFARFLRERRPDLVNETILVEATEHYMVCRGRKAADSKTGDPVFLSKMPGRRMRIERAWLVEKRGEAIRRPSVLKLNAEIDQSRAAVAAERKADVAAQGQKTREVKKLVAEFGLTFEVTQHGYEFEIAAPTNHIMEDLQTWMFSGPDRWADALETLHRWKRQGETLTPIGPDHPVYCEEEE